MNAFHHIAKQLEEIDPIMAYDLTRNLKKLIATDRAFLVELNELSKKLSNPLDQVELTENKAGGWDWTHVNTDGRGSRDMTGWRLQPSEVIKMLDSQAKPGPMVEEIKNLMTQEMSTGNAGIPRGAEMGGGPSAVSDPTPAESGGVTRKTQRDPENYTSVWDVATRKLLKKAILVAHDNPTARPLLLPILRKAFGKV